MVPTIEELILCNNNKTSRYWFVHWNVWRTSESFLTCRLSCTISSCQVKFLYISLTFGNTFELLRLYFDRNGKISSLFFNFPLSCSWGIARAFAIPFSINSVGIFEFSKVFFILQPSFLIPSWYLFSAIVQMRLARQNYTFSTIIQVCLARQNDIISTIIQMRLTRENYVFYYDTKYISRKYISRQGSGWLER